MSTDDIKIEETAEETPEVTTQVETEDVEETPEEGGVDLEEDVESEDSLTFSNGVIEKIVALAMRDVPGVVGMKGGFLNLVQDAFGMRDARRGVSVEVAPDSSVRVNVAVFMSYGSYAPKVFEDVKHAITDAVTGMTGLEIAGVNLRIEDVLTPEEIEARAPKLPAAEEKAPEVLPEAEIEPADAPEAELEAEAEAAE